MMEFEEQDGLDLVDILVRSNSTVRTHILVTFIK